MSDVNEAYLNGVYLDRLVAKSNEIERLRAIVGQLRCSLVPCKNCEYD